ncbi:hypothetical protein T11_14012 [Trichinella zimbabwensis]|uniref:Uncharacterized protein n=1 Tax=Trichinella zimbabwensis TaxID=268475 RepID=A0A0V1GGT2_9BILA|nr:hypothetical protein T11_14012 [Trichinella zimbabwensis]
MSGIDLEKSQNYNEPVGTIESDMKSSVLIIDPIIAFY